MKIERMISAAFNLTDYLTSPECPTKVRSLSNLSKLCTALGLKILAYNKLAKSEETVLPNSKTSLIQSQSTDFSFSAKHCKSPLHLVF